jgi:4-hydroxy-tetrahydrodipicolinate synthase
MIKAGGAGLISVAGNAWPQEMKQIVDEQDAMMQSKMGHRIHLLFVEGNPSGIKTVLAEMGIIQNVLRLPMVPCTENTQMVIRRALSIG